jgi:hypothetical protein
MKQRQPGVMTSTRQGGDMESLSTHTIAFSTPEASDYSLVLGLVDEGARILRKKWPHPTTQIV